MNSEDVRNDPHMKPYWSRLSHKRRMVNILTIGAFAILFACFIAGCPDPWPVVITGGGNGDTLEGGK